MWPGLYLYSSDRRSWSAFQGQVPGVSDSVKIIAEPAGWGTCCTQGPVRSNVLKDEGQGRLLLWLPGIAAKPPSPELTFPNAYDTTIRPLNICSFCQW